MSKEPPLLTLKPPWRRGLARRCRLFYLFWALPPFFLTIGGPSSAAFFRCRLCQGQQPSISASSAKLRSRRLWRGLGVKGLRLKPAEAPAFAGEQGCVWGRLEADAASVSG